MKVLVATHDGQGHERDDYCWTVDGELVTPVAVACSNPGCGCERGFPGLASERATTTAMVVERPGIDEVSLWNALADSLERQGWLTYLTPVERDELISEHLDAIVLMGESFREGTVLRRHGDVIRESSARGRQR